MARDHDVIGTLEIAREARRIEEGRLAARLGQDGADRLPGGRIARQPQGNFPVALPAMGNQTPSPVRSARSTSSSTLVQSPGAV